MLAKGNRICVVLLQTIHSRQKNQTSITEKFKTDKLALFYFLTTRSFQPDNNVLADLYVKKEKNRFISDSSTAEL